MKYNKLENLALELGLTDREKNQLDLVVDGELDLITDLYNGLYFKLYEHFMNEMPYGTAKARDGDPDQWIQEHLVYLTD